MARRDLSQIHKAIINIPEPCSNCYLHPSCTNFKGTANTHFVLRPVHNIRSSKRSVICLRHVATGSAYKMIWTRVAHAGIEIISISAYAHVTTCVQIIFYALPVATLAQAYIVNRPLHSIY